MRTLLTGFGPFGDVVDNPTARIVAYFAEDPAARAPGHALTARVLPVSFERADREIVELLGGGAFDAALLLGVAGRDMELRVERLGRNLDRARIPDADGESPFDAPIRPGSPETLACALDAEALVTRLRDAGLPARVSEHAGGYVCNRAYYAALHTTAALPSPCRCLFLHVPPAPDSLAAPADRPTMPLEQQIAAVRIALDWMKDEG